MEEIKEITINDKDYPESLKKISGAPKVLYYKGVLPTNDEKIVAVVGTRRPSDYGKRATLEIAGELTNAGLTIISGMAPGIDTFAHTICVEKKCRTIAVLGTGLDEKTLYPQSNLRLSREIIENGGCLISEYPTGTHGSKITFPQRNRIVSALSLGVVIIEAKEKSGSLVTARWAKSQKRPLFAVPGPIYTLNSSGPNKLIKEGATLTESAQDILDVLGLETKTTQQSEVFSENSTETAIFAALKEEALAIDAIIAKTKLSAPVIGSTLALMEISGKVRNLGGNTYAIS